MRIHFAAVVVELVRFEVVAVLNQQLNRHTAVLCPLDSVTQNLGGEATAVDRQQLHAGTDAGLGRNLTLNGIDDASVIVQVEADGEGRRNEVISACRTGNHLGRRVVVHEFPSAAFDAAQRCTWTVVRQAVGPKATPVVRHDLIQRVDDIVERVGLKFRASAGRSVEEMAEIIDRFLAFALLANDDVDPKPVQRIFIVEVIIREQSKGKKSIDDFCHLFHGAPSTGPELKTYTFEDVVNALNQIVPYDWRGFWNERLTNHGPGAPLGGIEGSGWKLVYDDTPSEMITSSAGAYHFVPSAFSIGLNLNDDGGIVDTIEGEVAAKAGIGPGMKLLAVNGRRFTPEILRDAIKRSKNGSGPIELLIENSDYFKTYKLDYHGGEMYPHLVRDTAKPDLLSEILKAK